MEETIFHIEAGMKLNWKVVFTTILFFYPLKDLEAKKIFGF